MNKYNVNLTETKNSKKNKEIETIQLSTVRNSSRFKEFKKNSITKTPKNSDTNNSNENSPEKKSKFNSPEKKSIKFNSEKSQKIKIEENFENTKTESPKRSTINSFNISSTQKNQENNNKLEEEKISKKFRVMRKIELNENENEKLKEKIEEKFQNAEEYLNVDRDLIFGKRIWNSNDIKKTNNLENKKSYQLIGDINVLKDFNNRRYAFLENSKFGKKLIIPKHALGIISNQFDKHSNGHSFGKKNTDNNNKIILTDEKIENFFNEKKENKNNLRQIENEVFSNIEGKYKEQMKGLFKKQNDIIERKLLEEKKISNFSKNLALKINKKEEELLFNSTDGFRLKKELKSVFEENSEKNTKYGYNNDWIFSLRESQNLNKANKSEINRKYYKSPEKKKENFQEKNTNFTSSPNSTNFTNTKTNFNTNTNTNTNTNSYHKPVKSMFYETSNSFYPNMSTETRFINVNGNSNLFVSMYDPKKHLFNSNGFDKDKDKENKNANWIYNIEKIRKPNLNQNKYLKNFIECKTVKDKLNKMNIIGGLLNNFSDLNVNFFIKVR